MSMLRIRCRCLLRVLRTPASVHCRVPSAPLHYQLRILLPQNTMRLPRRDIARPRISSRAYGLATPLGRRFLTNNGFFRVSEEVREAIHSKKPVVALETTIYTHGE